MSDILLKFKMFISDVNNGTLKEQTLTPKKVFQTSREAYFDFLEKDSLDYYSLPALQKLYLSKMEIKDHYKKFIIRTQDDGIWLKPNVIDMTDCSNIQEQVRDKMFNFVNLEFYKLNPKELFLQECPLENPTVDGAKFLIETDLNYWYCLPKSLAYDKEIILHSIKENGFEILSCLPEHIYEDYEFIKKCHQLSPIVVDFLPDNSTIKIRSNILGSADSFFEKMDLKSNLQEKLTSQPKNEIKRRKI